MIDVNDQAVSGAVSACSLGRLSLTVLHVTDRRARGTVEQPTARSQGAMTPRSVLTVSCLFLQSQLTEHQPHQLLRNSSTRVRRVMRSQ